ncbi:hypothetical protein LSAT2_014009, partial [Lamellibrachia satsuma]
QWHTTMEQTMAAWLSKDRLPPEQIFTAPVGFSVTGRGRGTSILPTTWTGGWAWRCATYCETDSRLSHVLRFKRR